MSPSKVNYFTLKKALILYFNIEYNLFGIERIVNVFKIELLLLDSFKKFNKFLT